ncbi:MAG: hypothetical protein GY803_21630, partial [Chloroflexi bacterium]|nr:hypothetical protein [Chloroflexota bacterium]
MGKRRNPFADWMDDNAGQDGPEQGLPLPGQPEPPLAAPPPPRSVLDQLGLPEPEKKGRGRAWEKRHRTRTYRGIPKTIRTRLNEIAQHVNVKLDDVVRACLEFGLEDYQAGQLVLEAAPRGRYMTLYPADKEHAGWERGGSQKPSRASKRRTKATAKNTASLAIRGLPDVVHTALGGVANQLHVPLGEVVTVLLTHAIRAYNQGRLALIPIE